MLRLHLFLESPCLFMLFFMIFLSCSSDKGFDREVWVKHNSDTDWFNPRANMTDDLLKNYLKPGIAKDSVLALLGKPYKEGIERRLPKGLIIPDSLDFKKEENITHKKAEELNKFYRLNSQPDTLMLYPVGHSTMDVNFLVIKFNGNGRVSDFWVEQH